MKTAWLGLVMPLALALVACGSTASAPGDSTAPPSGGDQDHAGRPSSPNPTTNPNPTTDEELPAAPFCETSFGGTEGDGNSWESVSKKRFQALAPAPRAEYMSLRRNLGSLPSPGLTKDLETVAERGQICAGAASADACSKAYAALSPPITYDYHLCYTRGDAVACVESKAEAMSFLGEVHSIEEAFFVAYYEGYAGTCGTDVSSRALQLADGSYQLAAMKGGDCGPVYRAVINVSKDGTIKEIEATKLQDSSPCP